MTLTSHGFSTLAISHITVAQNLSQTSFFLVLSNLWSINRPASVSLPVSNLPHFLFYPHPTSFSPTNTQSLPPLSPPILSLPLSSYSFLPLPPTLSLPPLSPTSLPVPFAPPFLLIPVASPFLPTTSPFLPISSPYAPSSPPYAPSSPPYALFILYIMCSQWFC